MFNSETYSARRKSLRSGVESGIILLIGNNEASKNFPDNWYHYRQDSTFLYFVGISKPGLMLCLDLEEDKEYLVGNEISIDDVIWSGNQPAMAELAANSGIALTLSPVSLSQKIRQAAKKNLPIHILPPYRKEQEWHWTQIFDRPWSEIQSFVSTDLIRAVVEQRNRKSEEEIEEIHRAVNITGKMHLHAMREALPGMGEQELTGRLTGIAVGGGGDLSFPIILSTNGQILHNHYHGNSMKEGDLLLVDCGAETSMGYAGDMTRTMPVSAKFLPAQRDIYDLVLAAQLRAIDMLKPGITYREVHLAACTVIATGLKDIGIIKGDIQDAVSAGAHALFMPHGLGHMMGLDVHDMEDLGEDLVGYEPSSKRSSQFGLKSLRLARPLEPGFVLTVEPGIYFIPELIKSWEKNGTNKEFLNFNALEQWFKFGGIRIEDDYLITPNGAQLLGDPVAKTVLEVEEIRRQALDK